ncbi:FUSC family protein [Streptomyces sp. NBC_01264]|uniref:FUSC family protein n=1 Tax=Streptomyces sp. NBC_01264 TaxID=2903804 RepID=UPI002257A470|nr:FUSC family protein [Streptomyces sp. NBC_01264]MCX4775522.1 FUSC family protein [Streptomyces sp. NBC_01264]
MPGFPAWLRHAAEIRAVPVDRALVARGAVGMLVPLAVGQLAGRPDLGAAAGLGAYGAAVDDTAAPWRTRALTLLLPQFGGAIGLALGRLTGGQAWAQILLVAAVALVSGLLSTIGRISDMAALVLLLATTMGLGLPTAQPWWHVPLLFLLGGVPLMLLSLTDALRHPGRAERQAVAGALRAVADLLDADENTWTERRHRVTGAMDAAYDTVVIRRLSPPRPSSTAAQLAAHLDRLIEVIASAPAVRTAPARESAAEYSDAVRRVADAVETRTPGPIALPPAPQDRAGRALRAAVAALATPGEEPAAGRPRLLPARPTPPRRLSRAVAGRSRDPAARRYALRLALCLTVAQAVASFSGLPRSGWLVLTVALVVRPGLGTVPDRLVTRAIGTTAGVLIGLAAVTVLPTGWWRIAAVVVLTALLQAYALRNYALQTLFLTPVMLLLADPLGLAGSAVPAARLLDTLAGCGIALVCGYLIWPEDIRARVPDRLARAYEAIAEYADHALTASGDAGALHTLRRRIHGDLAAVHTELTRLRTDPRHHDALETWRIDLAHAERVMAGLTTTSITGHSETPGGPSQDGAVNLGAHLRRRAAHLREHRPGRTGG